LTKVNWALLQLTWGKTDLTQVD